jgi:hypothetical protein
MAARASLTVCSNYILYLTATFTKADPTVRLSDPGNARQTSDVYKAERKAERDVQFSLKYGRVLGVEGRSIWY